MNNSRYRVGSFGEVLVHPPDGSSLPLAQIQVAREMLTWLGQLRPIVRDLLHIATAVHHVDRIAPSSAPGDRRIWHDGSRRIELEIAVIEVGQWKSIGPELQKLLQWMTDDQWELTFRRSEVSPPRQLDWRSERLAGAQEVALFSGGLDSVVGAYLQSRERGRPVYLLSSLGTNVRAHFLKKARGALKGVQHRWIGFRHQLRASGRPLKVNTPNRTRGFLFLSAAAAVADSLGVNHVTTYECGVGALNLPMNAAQLGAQNTRAMHPSTLMQLERILKRVLQKEIQLEAPFLLSTKGELCRRVGDDLSVLADASNSCDETERNKRDLTEHCGVCTSCLLRRVSLHAAMGEQDPTWYRCHETRRNGRYQVDAFYKQARRFADMTSYEDLVGDSRTVDFAVEYLREKTTPRLTPQQAEEQVFSLFKRHAAEVISFYEQQSPGNLLERPRQPVTKPTTHDFLRATW